MSQWKELADRLASYYPDPDLHLLERCRALLESPHPKPAALLTGGDAALSAVPYDPFAVAFILTELRLDVASLATGLIAGSVIAREVSVERVRAELGEDVAFLVDGVARISLLAPELKGESQAEDFRKMILAMSKDIRVILVRLAMCLQQVRGVVVSEEPPPERLPTLILDIFAPIAHRLGIHWVKSELEDSAFRLSNPEEFQRVRQFVAERRKSGGEDEVEKVVAGIRKRLQKNGIAGEVYGREKHLYSIWSKLERKNLAIEEVPDLIAYRIIVKKKNDCYRALGMIHSDFKPIPGRFKDYIALPKSNGYQSLHTGVIGPFGSAIEIQIRTRKMHDVAERGVAAHWVYKGGGVAARKGAGSTGYAWLQHLLEEHRNAEDPRQFLENVRIDLFPEEIYVFTPRGAIITLPRGATPVDFAYAVHSEVGDRCQGAKVNGRIVPLRTKLETGDMVMIITGKNQHPSQNWLEFVVTSHAKYRISRWIKVQQREQSLALGRELLDRELRKSGQGVILNEKAIQRGAESFSLKTPDELLQRVAESVISPLQALHRIFPEILEKESKENVRKLKGIEIKPPGAERREGGGASLRLAGPMTDMVVETARCCMPVPGDRVVGIISTGRGISLHRTECPNLISQAQQHPERLIEEIDWGGSRQGYTTRLRAMVTNQKGVLAQISKEIAEAKAGVMDVAVRDRDRDPCVLIVEVEVRDREHLELVMARLRALSFVFSMERIKG
ncbi:MAG: bifunctional (p)ppGpp synthetase/guanosine-3',5'-bis(diphosphate) 3'-pyrophosphohydrolase [Magnetococcales bacterium]|nr:bifunctional (p)ppGpp synthetase/guanosine-3',5'-bis(diphosphate) 3'-pyrophosphohydrolase [Magnetococcales bacterium]